MASKRFSAVAGLAAVVAAAPAVSFVIPNGPQRPLPIQQKVSSADQQVLASSFFIEQPPVVEYAASGDGEGWMEQAGRWLSAGVVAGLFAAALTSTPAEAYNTPILGKGTWEHEVGKGSLTLAGTQSKFEPCSKSKKYAKRIKDSLYKIQTRQAKYPEGSVVYNRFVERTARTKTRAAGYADRLCGKKDGLPRVFSDGTVKSGVIVPFFVFLYIAGWIGWAGRSYLRRTRSITAELNMDVPLALTCMTSAFAWPVLGWQAIVTGKMAVNDYDLYRNGPM